MINFDSLSSVLILCVGGLGLLTVLVLVVRTPDSGPPTLNCTGVTTNGTCKVKGCGTNRKRLYFCGRGEDCVGRGSEKPHCDCEEGFWRKIEGAKCFQQFTKAFCERNKILMGVQCVKNHCTRSQYPHM